MKLLIATGIYPPEIGGPATYLQKLIPLLNNSGWETTVLTYGEPRPGVYTVRRKRFALFRMFLYARHLWTLTKTADAVFTTDTFSAGLPALIISKIRQKPLVVRLAGIFAYEEETKRNYPQRSMSEFLSGKKKGVIKIISLIERFILRNADHVIATCPFLHGVCQKLNVSPQHLTLIDTAPVLTPVSEKKEELRKAFGFAQNKEYVISISRLIPHKCVDTIIFALNELPEKYTLLIIGEGQEESRLKEITDKLKLDKRVIFLGRKKLNEVHQYLKAADAYILNSKYESYANTALEAMAIGTPVFLSRVEGSEDLIVHGKTGHFFTQNDTSDIALQLKKIENKALVATTTEAAKKAVNTWENVFSRTKEILEKLTL